MAAPLGEGGGHCAQQQAPGQGRQQPQHGGGHQAIGAHHLGKQLAEQGHQTAAHRAEHQGTHHHGQGLEGDLQIGGLDGQGDAQHEIGRSQQGQTAQDHGFFFGTHKKQNAPFTACCHERSWVLHGSGCGFSDAGRSLRPPATSHPAALDALKSTLSIGLCQSVFGF